MPRVLIKKDDYIQSDAVAFIEGKTREHRVYDKDVAKAIGLSPAAYCQRKKEKLKLGYIDLVRVIRKLELSDEDIVRLMRGKF